jgi:hypothetical protein
MRNRAIFAAAVAAALLPSACLPARAADFPSEPQAAELARVQSAADELARRRWLARVKELAAQALSLPPFSTVPTGEPELVSTVWASPEKGEKRVIHAWLIRAPGRECRFASAGADFNGRYDARVVDVYGFYCMPDGPAD